MCLEAIYPSLEAARSVGSPTLVETLSCAKFKFNWHLNYVYSEDVAPLLPAGTVLHGIAWHDNTSANKMNNDPDALITWGNRTIDEMQEPWLNWYYMTPDEFKRELEERQAGRISAGSR